MAIRKRKSKEATKKVVEKQGIKMTKLKGLSKAELSKIRLEDLWVLQPRTPAQVRARLCGCRNVCQA
ncbi:MAG: hypothetical protein GY800_08395 [Planctomycetes bacterium]|nr:hypothetical protein [Planctomycetota bacterium]